MVFNLITFLLLLLCLYLAILYQSTAACALFLFLFIDWILGLMILLYSRKHLKIELPDIIINDNEANKLLEFHLQAQNTGIFPMPYLRLKWHFTDAFQNKISLPDYYFSLNAKKTSVLSGTISNDYYGKFHLQANKVRIYSFTHLLSLPVACKAKADILFYPSPFVIPIQLSEGIRFFSAECDGFDRLLLHKRYTGISSGRQAKTNSLETQCTYRPVISKRNRQTKRLPCTSFLRERKVR